MYTNGIDVSVAQGAIDWAKVRAAGIRFAYVRGYHATDRDSRADAHLAGANSVGIIPGVYLFPDFKQDAREQILAIDDLVRKTYCRSRSTAKIAKASGLMRSSRG